MRLPGRAIFLVAIFSVLFFPYQQLAAQIQQHPRFGLPNRPLIKLTGYINPQIPKANVKPVLTLKLPAYDTPYKFLLTDFRIMAGPLQTPESILSEVKPYAINFHVRASREFVSLIANATPVERLIILAEYESAGRILLVNQVEKLTAEGIQ